ncbi:MAG: hypothetical protein AB8I08_01600 [Sandaracinaceae bacterium]
MIAALAGCGADGGTDGGPTPADGGGGDCDAEGVPISGEIGADATWSCPLYVLEGQVFVTDGATLTIDAGTEVLGETGGSTAAALLVTRGSQLVANGTAEAPIVFTSGNPVGARATGDWAGVALLGAATTNDGECVEGSGDACDGGFLQDRIEGIDPADPRGVYGGTNDSDSCGSLRYVRIEFAGRELSPDNELNGLTVGGCGSGTTLSHIQVHRGKDDGVEFFGGTASLDHVIISGASDDSLDFDEGWRGNGQFIVIHQFPGIGDRGIEADNFGSNELATPTTRPNLWNVTMIGTTENQVALFREGMQGVMGNFLITTFGTPIDVNASVANPNAAWPADFSLSYSVLHDVGEFPAEDMSLSEFWAEADMMAGGTLDDAVPENLRALTRALDDADMTPEQADRISDLLKSRLDDDFGFDESARLRDADNTFDIDPQITASATAPNYVPGHTALPTGTTPSFTGDFGDTTATFVGAIDPAGSDWTAGWTAYPEN